MCTYWVLEMWECSKRHQTTGPRALFQMSSSGECSSSAGSHGNPRPASPGRTFFHSFCLLEALSKVGKYQQKTCFMSSFSWVPCLKGQGYTVQQGSLDPQQLFFSNMKIINGHNPSHKRLEEMRLQKCTFMTRESTVGCWQGWGVLIRRVGEKKPFMRN